LPTSLAPRSKPGRSWDAGLDRQELERVLETFQAIQLTTRTWSQRTPHLRVEVVQVTVEWSPKNGAGEILREAALLCAKSLRDGIDLRGSVRIGEGTAGDATVALVVHRAGLRIGEVLASTANGLTILLALGKEGRLGGEPTRVLRSGTPHEIREQVTALLQAICAEQGPSREDAP
jgi:hypothetical protein